MKTMILVSDITSALEQAKELEVKLQIPECYRGQGVVKVKMVGEPHFTIHIGEIHCGVSYILCFDRAKLVAIGEESWTVSDCLPNVTWLNLKEVLG